MDDIRLMATNRAWIPRADLYWGSAGYRRTSDATVGLVGVEGFQGDLQDLGNFFWRAMIVSARCSFRWSLRFSASNCFTRGSIGRGVGPRRRPRMSRRAPCSRCRRQFATCELYKPSRRSSAPSSPGRLHASACLRMPSRYSAVKAVRLIPLLLLAWAPAADAYVGPGVGLGAIALVAGMLGSIGLWFLAILWYPFRRMLHRRREAMKQASAGAEDDASF